MRVSHGQGVLRSIAGWSLVWPLHTLLIGVHDRRFALFSTVSGTCPSPPYRSTVDRIPIRKARATDLVQPRVLSQLARDKNP